MIAEQVLPITPGEFSRDSDALTEAEALVPAGTMAAARNLAAAKRDLDLALPAAWANADGKTGDERKAQANAAVADLRARVVDMEGRVEAAKQNGFIATQRSKRLITAAEFAMRQMELDTPGPDRAPHWERT